MESHSLKESNFMVFYLILGLIIIALAVVFAVENMTAVTVAFFTWTIHTNLAVALLVALGVGVLVALLFTMPGIVRSGFNSSGQKKKMSKMEAERDKYKQQAEDSSKEITTLEEQLASYSAELDKLQSTENLPGPDADPSVTIQQ
jgi:uncharacterized integral membrane protein